MAASPPTFAHQDRLPSLPVPPLRDSIARHLRSIVPLVTSEELARVTRLADEFIAPGGAGDQLQAALVQRSKEKRNWLSAWWFDYAYLKWPDPTPINSNYYMMLGAEYFPEDGCPLQHAAEATVATFMFRADILAQRIPVETMQGGKVLMCMDQYKRLFGSCRIPGENGDSIRLSPQGEHVIVLSHGYYYHIPACSRMDVATVTAELRRIQADSAELKYQGRAEPPIGLLTASARPMWADARRRLLQTRSAETLELIETAAFLVVLDGERPNTTDALAWESIAGNAGNRFFDHVLQFIAFDNGRLCINGEHSPIDAIVTVLLINHIQSLALKLREAAKSAAPVTLTGKPRRLTWTLPEGPEFPRLFMKAEREWIKFSRDLDLTVLYFHGFGSDFLSHTAKISPDAFIQNCLQFAYYRDMGKFGATYETGQTRMYYEGRTETCRSCSQESAAWVHSMEDPNASVEARRNALIKSTKAHTQYMRDACNGAACDRHLLGLRVLSGERGIKSGFLADPTTSRTTTWMLSTSNCNPLAGTSCGGFGPVCMNGYGACYCTTPNMIKMSISSARSHPLTSSPRFRANIERALMDAAALFSAAPIKAKL